MKRMLALSIAFFCLIIASAQKIEFKGDNIYLNNKKIDAYECKDQDFIKYFGHPDEKLVKTFIEMNYNTKGMEVYFGARSTEFEHMYIYFQPFEKIAAFTGEFIINGNKITRFTSAQELKKMKGIKMIKEPENLEKYNDIVIESGDMRFTFTYNFNAADILWVEAEL